MAQENIFEDDSILLGRKPKEALMNQRAKVIWMTGLSGSGKSTLAHHLEEKLHEAGYKTALLDGDNIRSGLNKNLSFSSEDRMENIRRIAEVAALFQNNGVITIASFISPLEEMRNMAKEIIGQEHFIEIFVSTPLEICEERDVKGLYAKARAGEIKDFTGISAPFEEPKNPDCTLSTEKDSVEKCLEMLFNSIVPKIKRK